MDKTSCNHKKRASLVPLVPDYHLSSEFETDGHLHDQSSMVSPGGYMEATPTSSRPPSVISRSASRCKSPEPSPCNCGTTVIPPHASSPTLPARSASSSSLARAGSSTSRLDNALSTTATPPTPATSTTRLITPGVDGAQRVAVDGHAARASLNSEGLHVTYDLTRCCMPGVASETIPFHEILSAKVYPPVVSKLWNPFPHTMHRLAIYTFSRGGSNPGHWRPRRLIVSSPAEGLLHQWAGQINVASGASPRRPRHVLVIVNPYGGKGKAIKVYERGVRPVFERAGIQATVHSTQFGGHARSIVLDMAASELAAIDGIVAVGGDGLFHEIINGLLELRSSDTDLSSPAASIRVGHIPAGSTDAVACTLNGTRSAFTAAMHIALGDGVPLDVLRLDFGDGTKEWAVSMSSYGYFGDVMREGEGMRWLGPLRYDVVGAKMLAANRSYRCRVSYLPAEATRLTSFTSVCGTQCEVCAPAFSSPSATPYNPGAGAGSLSAAGAVVGGGKGGAFRHHSSRALAVRSEEWKTIEGDFAGIQLVIMPCRSDKSLHGVARYGHLSDGNIHLVLVRRCSRWQYLQFLLKLSRQGLEAGRQGGGGYIEVVPAVAVKVESLDAVGSQWNVDGELCACPSLTAETHRGAIEVFARGVES